MSRARQEQIPLVVVGAGHAGGTFAAKLRQLGFEGEVVLVGSDSRPPYQRPPLSKAWLKGEAGENDLFLRPESFYADRDIRLELATTAAALDRTMREVRLADGRVLEYSKLVVATGTKPRSLGVPGDDLAGVLTLQTADDAERIKALIGPGRRLVVVGGGYLGLEIASAARTLRTDVVVLERENRLLARVASEPVSSFFLEEHQRQGVRVMLGTDIAGFLPTADDAVSAVELAGGETLPCETVVVSIGVTPNMDLALQAGLECGNGIVVDESGRTSDPDIYAIGDVVFRPMWDGTHARLESVPSALEMAGRTAAAITGSPTKEIEVPWFWSDQYDLKLQIAGVPTSGGTVEVRGDPAERSFSVAHMDGDELRAIECINAPREFVAGRRAIAARHAALLSGQEH